MAYNTLMNIILTQNYLENQQIPYLMSSYVNYWTDEKIVAKVDFGIKQFKDLEYLVNKINFDNWNILFIFVKTIERLCK